jgi:cytochrome c biogenesis protein ResB
MTNSNNNSPVNLWFYLELIAKEFISTVISSWHKHIQHIKSLEKSKYEKSKNFTKQNMQKYGEKKIPVTKKDDKRDNSCRCCRCCNRIFN